MASAFEGLEPRLLWTNFEAITRIPRPSKHEEKIVTFMLHWAKDNGFPVEQDEAGNVLVKVPATPGKEDVPVTVLQGHLDMVCEKNNDVVFDFMTQPLKIVLDGDWLKADGTTLGADNGIGVAMAMTLAMDKEARHGALELLFTIDEETGLTGATLLKANWLKGTRMVNIDSEEEGYIFVGCAGGGDSKTSFPLVMSALSHGSEVVEINARGMAGGHSGLTIHENRANALKVLSMLLEEVANQRKFHICLVEGGDKHNAIPREAKAVIAGEAGLKDLVLKTAEALLPKLMTEYSKTDPGLVYEVRNGAADKGLSAQDSVRLLALFLAIPHGVDTMSKDIPGLVETSTNMARVTWTQDSALILSSTRSSVAFALERKRQQLVGAARLAGAQIDLGASYPGWQPNMESKLLATAQSVYERVGGKKPVVTAIHAGLECGIIGEKCPGMDMISIGPTMFDVHSPKERLSVSSSARFYGFLKEFLASL